MIKYFYTNEYVNWYVIPVKYKWKGGVIWLIC